MMFGMRMRLIAVAGGWAAVAATATAVSWAGVGLVGAEVSPSGPGALSQAEVQRRIQAAARPASGSGPTTPGPATTVPPASGQVAPGDGSASPGAVTTSADATGRSVVTVGGTVALSCSGDQISARWSASQGYVMSEDPGHDPSTVHVEFSNGTLKSSVRAGCRGGILTVTSQEGRAEE
jgi:hypothetical protein